MFGPADASEPINLYCARDIAGFGDAERIRMASGAPSQGFVKQRPPRSQVAWALTDCLRTASTVEVSRNIVARGWYVIRREPGTLPGRELLRPHASDSMLYQTSSKKIVLHQDFAANSH
jgi:hypothetical protein